jgi:hypothetical protein
MMKPGRVSLLMPPCMALVMLLFGTATAGGALLVMVRRGATASGGDGGGSAGLGGKGVGMVHTMLTLAAGVGRARG